MFSFKLACLNKSLFCIKASIPLSFGFLSKLEYHQIYLLLNNKFEVMYEKINIVLVYCIVTILPIFTSEKAESVDQKVLVARNEVFNVMKNFEEGKEIHEEMVLETYASLQRASKLDRGNGIVYLNFAFQILGNLETSYYINFDLKMGLSLIILLLNLLSLF